LICDITLATEPTLERIDGIYGNYPCQRARLFSDERFEAGCAFSRKCGREGAIEEASEWRDRADPLFERMQALPALTLAGKAAKVRALLVRVMGVDWRGPVDEMDWGREQARALLGEFAGPSADELAAI
jgi:hypothetical protein